MKTNKKIPIITAAALIAAGLFITFGALAAMNFDFTKMNSIKNFETNTYNLEEPFTNITIKGAECDIRFFPSENDSCRIVCKENDKIFHTVSVENNTLTVIRTDNRKWYEHIGIYWGNAELDVYLPQAEYKTLDIASVSGDIEIPDNFSFTEAQVHNTSGDIDFQAPVKNDLLIKTVSGKIYADGASAESLNIHSTSGKLHIKNITAGNLNAQSTSGSITLSKVLVSGDMHIKDVSGKVRLEDCDAGALSIKTVSGNVSGTLLTDKKFLTRTTSGDVDVPQSSSGGKCEIQTTSGDISIAIE